jgi:DNA-binding LytR/AlgR family response regulator
LIERFGNFRVVETANTGEQLIDVIRLYNPDVVFVDIDLPYKSGMEAVRQIQQEGFKPLVVFVTAHVDYALEAFDLAAVDYLIKPIDEERLYRILNRISQELSKGTTNVQMIAEAIMQQNKIFIKIGHAIHFIKQQDIIFIGKKNKKSYIVTTDNTYEAAESLFDIEKKLNEKYFIRSHRSYIINLTKVKQIYSYGQGAYSVKFDDTEEEAFINRDKVQEIFTALKIPYT